MFSTAVSVTKSAGTGSSKRKFLPQWIEKYTWLSYRESSQKSYCSVCTEAYDVLKIQRSNTGANDDKSYNAFVKDGFNNWKKALEKFQSHEKNEFHRKASSSIMLVKTTQVSKLISDQALQSRKDARTCLTNIFESLRFLATQGIAIRGHTEIYSNFIQLLLLRATDRPLLKSWVERTTYRWVSHDIINEILSVMSLAIQRKLLSKIRVDASFYAFMADETTDVSRKEQMSVNFRVVDDSLKIDEIFLGFYDTPATDADTLFKVVKDVLLRFELPFNKCRGQCYDGAYNMSGSITGLQTRFREIEPRALFMHCAGHNLNLVAQDGMKKILKIADFLSVMKDLVKFVRASAKRNNIFKGIVFEDDDDDDNVGLLKPFCPTRWTVRVKSLKSVKNNYKKILHFCDEVGLETGDCGVKARGFSTYLRKFECIILLEISISTLEKVEELNENIQGATITFKSIIKRLNILKTSLNSIRSSEKFNEIWVVIEVLANTHGLENPVLPRKRIAPKRLDKNAQTAYFPTTPEEIYRHIYFEVIDQILVSIDTRFDSENYDILLKMEEFALKKCDIDDIKMHLLNNEESDFDTDRLILHREMFFDVISKKKLILDDLSKITIFLQNNDDIREFCSEYTKFIKLLLTYPQTVCIAERSFSSLKKLKTYLSANMAQKRTNDIAILYVHREIAYEIDLEEIMDEFIHRTVQRKNTFALKNEC